MNRTGDFTIKKYSILLRNHSHMHINWTYKPFSELSGNALYDALQLRQEVFVVEQHCAYLDADGKDLHAYHLLGYDEALRLVCYARIVPPGISYEEASIGRVVSDPLLRGKGIGRQLIEKSISSLEETFGPVAIRIGGQAYLRKFYESFGFEVSDQRGYFEDGILHYIMLRK